jgi:hypothetical protein
MQGYDYLEPTNLKLHGLKYQRKRVLKQRLSRSLDSKPIIEVGSVLPNNKGRMQTRGRKI